MERSKLYSALLLLSFILNVRSATGPDSDEECPLPSYDSTHKENSDDETAWHLAQSAIFDQTETKKTIASSSPAPKYSSFTLGEIQSFCNFIEEKTGCHFLSIEEKIFDLDAATQVLVKEYIHGPLKYILQYSGVFSPDEDISEEDILRAREDVMSSSENQRRPGSEVEKLPKLTNNDYSGSPYTLPKYNDMNEDDLRELFESKLQEYALMVDEDEHGLLVKDIRQCNEIFFAAPGHLGNPAEFNKIYSDFERHYGVMELSSREYDKFTRNMWYLIAMIRKAAPELEPKVTQFAKKYRLVHSSISQLNKNAESLYLAMKKQQETEFKKTKALFQEISKKYKQSGNVKAEDASKKLKNLKLDYNDQNIKSENVDPVYENLVMRMKSTPTLEYSGDQLTARVTSGELPTFKKQFLTYHRASSSKQEGEEKVRPKTPPKKEQTVARTARNITEMRHAKNFRTQPPTMMVGKIPTGLFFTLKNKENKEKEEEKEDNEESE